MDAPADLELLQLFHRCAHRMRNAEKHRGQGRLLSLLAQHGTLTQRALTDITGRRSATLSEQLESMERAGYILRARNGGDRRNLDVTLTPLGRQAAQTVEAERALLAGQLFSVLTAPQKRALAALLAQLAAAWETLPPAQEE